MFDMDPFGGKKVPCTKYQESGIGIGLFRSALFLRADVKRKVADDEQIVSLGNIYTHMTIYRLRNRDG